MDNTVIKIEHLTKKYKLYKSQRDRLLETMLPNQMRHSTKTVIDDMNLEVKKGEILRILGKNGAGKSTLLKMITGVLTPTSGLIEVNGVISSLLELGTAFNGDLTGYQNIFLHGKSKQFKVLKHRCKHCHVFFIIILFNIHTIHKNGSLGRVV